MKNHPTFTDIEIALADLRQGRMVILVDNENRENEGDLIIPAQHASADAINFMCQYGRGLVCLAMTEQDFTRLQIPMMAVNNRSKHQTAFGVSFEAAQGVSTGISVQDRAQTIKIAIDPQSSPSDIIMPGHIFPLKARSGGVLARPGHTEGSIDLARLAGCQPAAVICEIMNQDGSMARLQELSQFAQRHQLAIVSISDLIAYRIRHENILQLGASAPLPTEQWGPLHIQTFQSQLTEENSIAIIKASLNKEQPHLVRLHSECFTGDVLGSQRCDCGRQLDLGLSSIAEQGGVLLYLRQEGRGIGLFNKIKAYALQDQGLDTVEANHRLGFAADQRDYGMAAQMLRALGISQVRLLTNNPHKVSSMEKYGITVKERISLETKPLPSNSHYLRTKQQKLGHLLNIEGL